MNHHWTPARAGLCTAILLGLFLIACSDETTDPGVQASGRQVDANGCKSAVQGAPRGAPPLDEDCLLWGYDEESRTLQLIHENAGLNCCPEGEAAVTVTTDGLAIDEMPIVGLCDCLCLFDLVFEVTNLAPGLYQVAVMEHYLQEGDPLLVTTIDLTAGSSGTFCVPRSGYPWGP